MQMMEELNETNGENLFCRGKIRDVYEMDDRHLIIVMTDRISAHDRVFPNPIPGKGVYLTRLTNFWLDFLHVKNHRVSMANVPEKELIDFLEMEEEIQDRMMVVRKAEPFPVEIVIRGYLVGPAWEEYEKYGTVGGLEVAEGLCEGTLIPEGPILTPVGENVKRPGEFLTPIEAVEIVGAAWPIIIDMAFGIYKSAANFASRKGVVIADAKFEFGLVDGEITLIGEVLTPDSSRFWPKGEFQKSYDKGHIEKWLSLTDWEKGGESLPEIPKDIVEKTVEKYRTLSSILTRV